MRWLDAMRTAYAQWAAHLMVHVQLVSVSV